MDDQERTIKLMMNRVNRRRVADCEVVDAETGERLGTADDVRFGRSVSLVELRVDGVWRRFGTVLFEIQTGYRQTRRGRVPVFATTWHRQDLLRRRRGRRAAND